MHSRSTSYIFSQEFASIKKDREFLRPGSVGIGEPGDDDPGHGTSVLSLIAGATLGLATAAKIVVVCNPRDPASFDDKKKKSSMDSASLERHQTRLGYCANSHSQYVLEGQPSRGCSRRGAPNVCPLS